MADRSLLVVFAGPDDETSYVASMKRYIAEGIGIHVITATCGETGALGTNGIVIKRQGMEASDDKTEQFRQIHPPLADGITYNDLFHN
jgi:LmbE family N-acetylglucosaminyl deacetylase